MEKRLFYWELAGALFTAALGTLLHFTYDWSGGWSVAAAFSAVNESTWEHMKLLFFPLFFCSVVQLCCLGRTYPNFLAVRGVSTLAGTWGPLPWTSGCCGGGGSPPSGSSCWGWPSCGGWHLRSYTAPSIRRSWAFGRTR